MASGFRSGLKRFILWDYPRAGWQYDVMVGLILAFIFLTPKTWFRDQPRPSTVIMLQAHDNKDVFWIAPELLAAVPASQREARAGELVRERFGKRLQFVRMETIFDAESEIRGYMVVVKP
ncbi:MAG: hypothetical protein ABFD60_00490 [Bryobacteraceae bacterium]